VVSWRSLLKGLSKDEAEALRACTAVQPARATGNWCAVHERARVRVVWARAGIVSVGACGGGGGGSGNDGGAWGVKLAADVEDLARAMGGLGLDYGHLDWLGGAGASSQPHHYIAAETSRDLFLTATRRLLGIVVPGKYGNTAILTRLSLMISSSNYPIRLHLPWAQETTGSSNYDLH